MTIAACYVCGEGVVLAADSAATVAVVERGSLKTHERYYFKNQKVFPVGPDGTLGLVTWGMGNLEDVSYRSLIARFSDELRHWMPASVEEVAKRWCEFFWAAYTTELAQSIALMRDLMSRSQLAQDDEKVLEQLRTGLVAQFCLAGHLPHDRTPVAYEIAFEPTLVAPPLPVPLKSGQSHIWSPVDVIQRVLFGIDEQLLFDIVRSGHWKESTNALFQIAQPYTLAQPPILPLLDAADWIYSALSFTIQALKYSHLPPTCGGSIDLAIIYADRGFEWVRQKRLGSHSGGQDALDG